METDPNVSINLHVRSCSFCGSFELPDGTIAYIGVTACPACLKTDKTKTFREVLKLAKKMYHRKFEAAKKSKAEPGLIRSLLEKCRIGNARK